MRAVGNGGVGGGARALGVVSVCRCVRFWAPKPNEPNHDLAHPWCSAKVMVPTEASGLGGVQLAPPW